jgi:DNA-binding MarR family transcriptional regulator
MTRKRGHSRPSPNDLDPLIHERLRLGILSALAVQEKISFTELRDLLATTDGNLSVQARRLETAGYITCSKRFEGRKPKSTYCLSKSGRIALERYLETLSELIPDPSQLRESSGQVLRRDIKPLPSHS